MRPTVMIVEDDQKISNLIKLYLEKDGYNAVQAYDGKEAKQLFLEHDPCLVILDLMLPFISGEQFLEWVRGRNAEDPAVIILSAKARTHEKINGLRLGADDYMTKPFSPEELMAHVEAVLRRTGRMCQKIAHKGLVIKPRKGEVLLDGEHVELTNYEFNLLYLLMEHPGQVFTREQLLARIHPNDEAEIMTRTIDAHMKKLRRKIEKDPSKPSRIITVRGMGYKFIDS
ncbi:response regulator transcription factor [Thalassobacillus hwangdonensis]|uniref:Response regulator transcription factor n=1 Tax=Thalassobacillus hwangdonensis TaxID=546108 RepID=A0ABW3KZV1_9BACI